jgi:hypothetical protein
MRSDRRLFTGIALLAVSACSGSKANIQPDKDRDTLSDGLPAWVDAPCSGAPNGAICAVAESDFAATDVEAAKVDAETACKNRIADQISARVERLTERLSSAMKDLTAGQTVGERTVKDINQNYQQTTLNGIRFDDYFFWPSRTEPRKIFVRALVTVDSNRMSQDIVNAMLAGAMRDNLELKHEEAQQRLEAVRKKYLEEERQNEAAPKNEATPAP